MIYKSIAPIPPLQPYVKEFILAHFHSGNNGSEHQVTYFPKAEQGIAFFPRDKVKITTRHPDYITVAPVISIFGQQICRHDYHLSKEFLMIRVHFQPGILYRLLGVPLTDFTGRYVDATAFFSPEIIEINNRLTNCKDYNQLIRILESWLLSELKKIKREESQLDVIAGSILGNPLNHCLFDLAKQSYLSKRQFNRKFIERIGIGPKKYCRIARFNSAYQFKANHDSTDWLSVAVMFRYCDYQHMVKDFLEFTELSPPNWFQIAKQSPEKFLML